MKQLIRTQPLLIFFASMICCVLAHTGCSSTEKKSSDTREMVSEEENGDPQKGFDLLVNSGYVSCGIPESLSSFVDLGDEGDRVEGRNELNQEMPYYFTKYEAESGVNLLVANCLSCHASHFNGDLIVGLGDVFQNYARDLSQTAQLSLRVGRQILESPEEVAELEKFVNRSLSIAEYSRTLTAGVNPAINITAGIMSHLDPETLNWSESPILEVPDHYRELVVASNPPPWWWYKKKTRMFYSASGGGSHIVGRCSLLHFVLITKSRRKKSLMDSLISWRTLKRSHPLNILGRSTKSSPIKVNQFLKRIVLHVTGLMVLSGHIRRSSFL